MGVMKIQSKQKKNMEHRGYFSTIMNMIYNNNNNNDDMFKVSKWTKKNFNQPEQHCVITPFILFFSGCRLDLISSDRWKKKSRRSIING